MREFVKWNTEIGYEVETADLVGRVFTEVFQDGDEIIFRNAEEEFRYYHDQDCCECVSVESVVGDLSDLIGEPILIAEETSGNLEDAYERGTWTFYKFATRKGFVDVRWVGESNGYYSESVDMSYRKLSSPHPRLTQTETDKG
jgi:hypothetical protein